MKYPVIWRPKSKALSDITLGQNNGELSILDRNTRVKSAVFLDRDGTINVERGYILNPNDIELYPSAGEAIYMLNSLGLLAIVITNQASIDKKLLSVEQFESINDELWGKLSNKDAYYDALYFCPHSPEVTPGCICRKPQPGLILQAAIDFDIDLSSSFMVGDNLSDIGAGKAGGCKTILVLSGQGEKAYQELTDHDTSRPDFIAQTLIEAIAWVEKNLRK